MIGEGRPRTEFRSLLEGVEAAPPVEAVDAMARELGRMVGAREVSFLITDFTGDAAVRFLRNGAVVFDRRQGAERAATVPLAGTVYERVLRTQRPDVERQGTGARVIAPVTERGDAIGLLELVLPAYPDERKVRDVTTAAHVLAYVVIANRRHTDLFEWGQRSEPLSLAAEIQRRLLPDSFSCEAGQLTIAGWLATSSSIAGDTFDYSLDRDTLHLSITDAVGHSVDSAVLATLLVNSLRKSRRGGAEIADQARDGNDELAEHISGGRFVTGQLARIDLASGTATVVNAGHPCPYRLRKGNVEQIELATDLPFGIRPGREFRVQEWPLEAGDRVVFVTDGMLERNAARLDLPAVLTDTADLHPRDVGQALGEAVLDAAGGKLRDDATILCLDWYGGPARQRESTAGASEYLASS